jgi:hypothetical protein
MTKIQRVTKLSTVQSFARRFAQAETATLDIVSPKSGAKSPKQANKLNVRKLDAGCRMYAEANSESMLIRLARNSWAR